MTVAPGGASVPPSATIQFSATVLGSSNSAVNWSVDGIVGGSTDLGTIDATGLYTAPAADGTHLITATSQANDAAQGWQFVQVGSGSGSGGSTPAITVSVSPGSVSLPQGGTQQFTATVTGATNPAISWAVNGIVGGNSQVGTISAGGVYTAPLGTSGGATVTATVSGVTGGAGVTFGNPGGQY